MRTGRLIAALVLVVSYAVAFGASPAGAAARDVSGHELSSTPRLRAAESTSILYDQTSSFSSFGYVSNDYTTPPDDPEYDAQGADDFTVPQGESWTIRGVQVLGSYDGSACSSPEGPAQAVNVFFYSNAGTLPGTEVTSRVGLTPVTGLSTGSFDLQFPQVTLLPGTYWVSVQAVIDCNLYGEWIWAGRTVPAGNTWAWRNPGNGFSTGCTTYQPGTTCLGTSDPGLAFRLTGAKYACRGLPATIVGSDLGESLIGTAGPDVMVMLGGNDRANGSGGADLICGGQGNDKLSGGGGGDVLVGEAGNDKLKGQGGGDVHLGGNGNDKCIGGPGNDGGKSCETVKDSPNDT